MDLKETIILGASIESHWYYKAKADAMKEVLGKARVSKVLDVGAGSAFFSKYLLKHHIIKEACCVDTSYTPDDLYCNAYEKIQYKRDIKRSDADLVLLMDVLEHVDNDLEFLTRYIEKVPIGTLFLITVPAFQFLWSEHDIFLEHRRRYSSNRLKILVNRSKLQILSMNYFFGLVFPIACLTRIANKLLSRGNTARSQLKIHTPLINSLLATLCKLEIPLFRYNRIAGLTIFCLAIKR